MGDKLIAQVIGDTKAALDANTDTMLAIIETMKIASDGLTESIEDFTKNINDEFKKSKAILDNHVKRYNSSVEKLFMVDTKQKRFFYLGIFGGIATPFVLFVVMLFHVFN